MDEAAEYVNIVEHLEKRRKFECFLVAQSQSQDVQELKFSSRIKRSIERQGNKNDEQ